MDNINFEEFATVSLIPKGHIGVMFQKNPPKREFRDTITFFRDGRIHFVRFCYGESAGSVADIWSQSPMSSTGDITWNFEKSQYSKIGEAVPSRLFASDADGALYFDDKPYSWSRTAEYKTRPEDGYSFLKCLFIK